MKPSIGRIVHVTLSEQCAKEIGGNARAGDLAPAVVTAVFHRGEEEYLVNCRILGDGPGVPVWGTSLERGSEQGQWQWPERVGGAEVR